MLLSWHGCGYISHLPMLLLYAILPLLQNYKASGGFLFHGS